MVQLQLLLAKGVKADAEEVKVGVEALDGEDRGFEEGTNYFIV